MPWGLLIIVVVVWLCYRAARNHIAREDAKYKSELIRQAEQGNEVSATLLRMHFGEEIEKTRDSEDDR